MHSRDFALHDEGVTAFMREQLMAAFREDVQALTLLEEVLAEPDPNRYEISITSDARGLEMRRYLFRKGLRGHPAGGRMVKSIELSRSGGSVGVGGIRSDFSERACGGDHPADRRR